MPVETFVVVYTSPKQYAQDAQRQAASGWVPLTVTERSPRAGCFRIFTLGLWSLVFPPKPELVVTYQRVSQIQPSSRVSILKITPSTVRHCTICGGLCNASDEFCANCGSPLPKIGVGESALSLPDETGRFALDPGNPYNLDPNTGLPKKSKDGLNPIVVLALIVIIFVILKIIF